MQDRGTIYRHHLSTMTSTAPTFFGRHYTVVRNLNARRLSVFLLTAIIAYLFGACGGRIITVNGIEVYESQWQKATDELRRRVTFDLSCPADRVRFSLIKRTGRVPTEVGVEGCGHRAMYVRVVAYGHVGPWMLNVESQSTSAGATDAPVPPPDAQPPSPPPQYAPSPAGPI